MTPEMGFLEKMGEPFLREKRIEVDRKDKPLLYYMANKVTNAGIKELLINKKDGPIDLRAIKTTVFFSLQTGDILEMGEEKYCVGYTLCGFIMVIKNPDEIKEKEGDGKVKINPNSDKAIFEIKGPDGKKVGEDIQGYIKAVDALLEKIELYKKEIMKEFNSLNKKQ